MALIACVGDNCVDRYVGDATSDMPGGNALNVAVHLAADYYGSVGDDDEGRMLVDRARSAGVGVDGVELLPGRTGVTLVQVEDGERRFLREEYGASAGFRVSATLAARLCGYRWVHVARQPDALALAPALRAAGVPLSCDFCDAWDAGLAAELAPHLEVAFFSGDDAAAADAVERGATIAVATLGDAGSVAYTASERYEQAALPAQIVDTLGAGDALIAAFIAARLDGADPRASLRAGAEAAADACSHLGAWPTQDRSATRDEVTQ
ncbi:MAG: PfkB family carbohydrate kinase [Gaiellales bacterium]